MGGEPDASVSGDRRHLADITAGALDYINSLPSGMVQVTEAKSGRGLSVEDIRSWEREQNTSLPSDLTALYCHCNGFDIKWKSKVVNEARWRDTGCICILPLRAMQLRHDFVVQECADTGDLTRSRPSQSTCTGLNKASEHPCSSGKHTSSCPSDNTTENVATATELTAGESHPDPAQSTAAESHPVHAVGRACCLDDHRRDPFMPLPDHQQQRIDRIVWRVMQELVGSFYDLRDKRPVPRVRLTADIALSRKDQQLCWLILEEVGDVGYVVVDCAMLKMDWAPNNDYGTVWLVERRQGAMHRLAKTVASYVRLLMAHLGLHYWQLLLTPLQPPPHTMLCFERFIPDRLAMDSQQKGEGRHSSHQSKGVAAAHHHISKDLFKEMTAEKPDSSNAPTSHVDTVTTRPLPSNKLPPIGMTPSKP